jgi:hypothetical protein
MLTLSLASSATHSRQRYSPTNWRPREWPDGTCYFYTSQSGTLPAPLSSSHLNMPLQSPQLSFAIECDEAELETFDAKQQGFSNSSLIAAFVASQAGKVGRFPKGIREQNPNYRCQKFSITYRNKLLDIGLVVLLRIDGEVISSTFVRAQRDHRVIGIYKNTTSILPFKFQELELVGTFTCPISDTYLSSFTTWRRGRGRCSCYA